MVSIEESCSPVAASERAALGGAVKACVGTRPTKESSTVTARTAEEADTVEACDITKPGKWTWERTKGICLNGNEVTFTLSDEQGAVLGTALIDVKSSMNLRYDSLTWNELITVKVTKATNAVSNVNIKFDVDCTSSCSPTNNRPWTGTKTLGQGAEASGSVTYTSNVASGMRDNIRTKYHMYITATGTTPTKPNVSWELPYQANLRCDAELTTPGCVFSDIRASLKYSLSDPKHAAASAAYSFAQGRLRDWAPLTRADGLNTANRKRTCEEGSSDPFVHMYDEVPGDTCDEFPFAGSLEGGTNGALCADIIPRYEDGAWWIYPARTDKPFTYEEPCVRAHVSGEANSSAGGKYGALVKSARILDIEKYNVSVIE
ncbi:hypothetical protein AB0420_06620 [Streptomyces caelestis]|uniref:hypothetical protein n=1 Tax=Streptomyces TaxID=1883 RepID=UPI000AB42DAB|nr:MULTISPECIES: hypothetical protein [Streptomyces]